MELTQGETGYLDRSGSFDQRSTIDQRATREQRRANAVEALYTMGHSLLARRRVSDAACVCRALLTLAPGDERGWLALGACHEAVQQYDIALDLYGAGSAVVGASVRCDLARMRLLRVLGRPDQANDALDRAVSRAQESGDEAFIARVQTEARTS